jgi:membrane-associated phospholipid phosphatase
MSKLALALAVLVASHEARADSSYLHDGGAVPLFWLPLAGDLVIDTAVAPRSSPLLFDAHDGGATPSPWEVPHWSIDLVGAGVAAAYVSGTDRSRWYHAKGLAESMATASLADEVGKSVFGRHRPDWSPTNADPDESESFPSGHATEAFVIATYTALYLHGHVTGDHALAYAGLFGAAGLLGAERVYHHRHHVSDVVVGSLIGAMTSFAIYRYQDARADAPTGPSAPALSFAGSF